MKIHAYSFDKIDTYIQAVEKDVEKLQTKIHALAISILSHWANNPEDGLLCAEKMTDLQNASPYHRKAFADWVGLKSGMQWSKESERWFVHKDQKIKKDKLDAAKNEPFWKVSPPAKANPFTDEQVLKMLQGILDKQKKHEKNPVDGDEFSYSANEHIRAAIKALTTG